MIGLFTNLMVKVSSLKSAKPSSLIQKIEWYPTTPFFGKT